MELSCLMNNPLKKETEMYAALILMKPVPPASKEEMEGNLVFQKACKDLGMKPTLRQFKKFIQGKGNVARYLKGGK